MGSLAAIDQWVDDEDDDDDDESDSEDNRRKDRRGLVLTANNKNSDVYPKTTAAMPAIGAARDTQQSRTAVTVGDVESSGILSRDAIISKVLGEQICYEMMKKFFLCFHIIFILCFFVL